MTFPPLPQQTQVVQQAEPVKMTPKVSQFAELEEQLLKIHQKQPTNQQTTYSDAVRQSPTTVQQQFPQQQQQQPMPVQSMPTQQPVVQNTAPISIVSAQVQQPVAVASSAPDTRKVSRFSVFKVEEQNKQNAIQNQLQAQQVIQRQIVNSPEFDANAIQQQQQQQHPVMQQQPVQQMQNVVSPIVPQQSSQAQSFFQQHAGGVVSNIFKFYFSCSALLIYCSACRVSFPPF
jgi:hypothetical protein